MTSVTKIKLKRLLSVILVLALVATLVQVPVFAEGEPIYLPEADLSEEVLNSGVFNLSASGAEIEENAGAPYIFKVKRGGEYLPEATLRLDMIDITAKYGDDYTVRLYNGDGEGVQNSGSSKSIIEEIIDNADEIEEINDSDYIVSGELVDTEEEMEAFREDASIGAEYVAAMFGIGEGEASAEDAAVPEVTDTAEPEVTDAAEPAMTDEAEPEVTDEAEPEMTDEAEVEAFGDEAVQEADASTLRGIKALATGMENDIAPMDGGSASSASTERMLTDEMLNGL